MATQRRHRVKRSKNNPTALFISAFMVFGALALALLSTRAITRAGAIEAAQGVETTAELPGPEAKPTPSLPAYSAAESGALPAAKPHEEPLGAIRPSEKPQHEQAKSRGVLIFVIDDAGHNTHQLEAFLGFPGPLTIAVLPGLPHSAQAGVMTRAAGKELILHQPMEAINALDPGPGAIGPDMSEDQIRAILRANLAELPGAAGMNNHMGSKATSDVRSMSIVLDEARRAGIYFLDSLTISDSVVHSVAALMKLPTWERTVFLDNSPDRDSIIKYVNEGLKVAEKRGYAVMIGHVWSSELAQTLTDLYPGLIERGFSLSTISRFMMDMDDDDTGD
jgi:uncharacterized protein